MVGCDGAGNLLILLGGGDGTLTLSKYIADGCAWVTTADFNRDGNPDIAVGVSSTNADLTNNQVIVYLGDGKGGVSSQVVNSNVDFSETLEVADILRAHGDRFLDRYRSSFGFQQRKAFRAIQRCRTADLGGHRDACLCCSYQAISYNSCRNRHCPKCQTQARDRWLQARERELLATSYFHVVFTVPHELNVLALENPRLFYDLLFTASAQTLLKIASDPKHLGAEIGVIAILHTWGQNLLLHPHIHCVVPAGGSRRIIVVGSAHVILSSYP